MPGRRAAEAPPSLPTWALAVDDDYPARPGQDELPAQAIGTEACRCPGQDGWVGPKPLERHLCEALWRCLRRVLEGWWLDQVCGHVGRVRAILRPVIRPFGPQSLR